LLRPGLLPALLLITAPAYADDGPSIGFATVADALASLSEDPAVELGEEAGWTVADTMEGDKLVLWTFTSAEHEAHPSAVKRIMHQQEGSWHLEMQVLCEAETNVCDALVAEFQELNSDMQRRVQQAARDAGQNQAPPPEEESPD
jgi:hypothetical protein